MATHTGGFPRVPRPMLAVLAWRSAVQARYALVGCLSLLTIFQMIIVGQASALEAAHSFGRMAELYGVSLARTRRPVDAPGHLQRHSGLRGLSSARCRTCIGVGDSTSPPSRRMRSSRAWWIPCWRERCHGALSSHGRSCWPRAVFAAVTLMALGTQVDSRLFAGPQFEAPSVATSARMLAHLAGVAMCFGGFALAVATGAQRWSTAFTTAALVAVLLYLVDFLAIGWPPMPAIA